MDAEAVAEVQGAEAEAEWAAIAPEPGPVGTVFVPSADIGCPIRQASPAISGNVPSVERPCSASDGEAYGMSPNSVAEGKAAARGTLVAVCVSDRRTDPKRDVGSGELRVGHGLVGDAHAGLSEREVSLLAYESILRVRDELGIEAYPGCFAENLVVQGLDWGRVEVGDAIQVGETVLQVVQIGKPPNVAHTYSFQGVSVLPEEGVFCRVVRGGRVSCGDPVAHVCRGSAKASSTINLKGISSL